MKKILLTVATAAFVLGGCATTPTTHDTSKAIAKTSESASASSTKSAKPDKPKGPTPAEKKWAKYTHLRASKGVTESVIGDSRSDYVNVCQKPIGKVAAVIAKAEFSTQKSDKADIMSFVKVYCPSQTAQWKASFAAHLMTAGQYNAVRSAKEYLDTGAFSKAGLTDQLSSKYGEGFTREQAVYAVNHVKVNWFKQATKSAKEYLDTGGYSRAGLIEQLSSSYGEGFTYAQAVYGVTHAGL